MSNNPDVKSVRLDTSHMRDGQSDIADVASFAARLRDAAEEAGINQAELARRTGTKKQSIAEYWNGKRLAGADKIFPIADALDVSARWLLYGSPELLSEKMVARSDDWVWVPLHDLQNVADGTGDIVSDMIHVDRTWLLKTFARIDGLWFAPMPSDTLSDIVQRGQTLVLEDVPDLNLIEGRHYAFTLDNRVVVRRYDVVPGKIILSGSNPGIVPLTIDIDELGKSLVPLAHVVGVFSLRSI